MSVGGTSNTRVYFVDAIITDATAAAAVLLLLGDKDVSGRITAGVVKDLINTVVVALTGAPFTSAGLCIIRLEQDGDADDGKYWDGDSWEVAAAPPASVHQEVGQHFHQLPAAATTGRDGARIVVTFADTITEGSMTTICGTKEYLIGPVVASEATQLTLATATSLTDTSRSVHGSGGYDGSTLSAVFFARRDGLVLTTTTAATIRVFNAAGVALTAAIAASGPTSEGVWRIVETVALVVDVGSYITVSIADPGGAVPGVIPIASQS